MVADLLEVTVKGCTLLLSVDWIFGGIYIDDEPPFVSAPKEGLGRSADHIFQGFQPLTSCEDVVLEPAVLIDWPHFHALYPRPTEVPGQPSMLLTLTQTPYLNSPN
jgi:hypothetical protein